MSNTQTTFADNTASGALGGVFNNAETTAGVAGTPGGALSLDNFVTGRAESLAHLLPRPGFALVRHDVMLPFDVAADRIYNLACPASPVHYQRDPVRTLKTSMLGTLHCLDLAKRTGARVLQASTSEVYGDPAVHPQPEGYWGHVNPVGPRACYDEGKRCAETLMADFHRQEGVEIRIARIFNTYGPRMSFGDGRVVSNFIVQALRGDDLTVYGDGSQTRSFCYVDDMVAGLVAWMGYEGGETVLNLGNPAEHTIMEIAEEVLRQAGGRSRVAFRPLPTDDPRRRRPDITRARALLGFEPATNLRDGIARTLEDFRRRDAP